MSTLAGPGRPAKGWAAPRCRADQPSKGDRRRLRSGGAYAFAVYLVRYRDIATRAEAVGDHAAAERFRRLREDERRNRDQFLAVLRDLDRAE